MRVELSEWIVADSEICHGKPTFKGTRVLVSDVLRMLREGADVKEIKEAYPSLTREHINASLEFAAEVAENRFDQILTSA